MESSEGNRELSRMRRERRLSRCRRVLPLRLWLIAGILGGLLAAAPAHAAPFAYVTNNLSSGEVHQFDVGPGGGLTPLSPAFVPAGGNTIGVAVSPDGASLYAANQTSNDVSQYDVGPGGTLTAKTPASVPAGTLPAGVAVSPDGTSVYVANQTSNDISQYDVGPGGVLTPKTPATVPAGSGPNFFAVTPDGTSVYVTNEGDNTVSQYDVGPGGVLIPKIPPAVPTGSSPIDMAVSPDGANVYVANSGSDDVSQYDVGPGGALLPKIPPTVVAGDVAAGVAVSRDSASVYVTNVNDDTVSQYDVGLGGTLSPKAPATVATGSVPQLVAVGQDGGSVYVANFLGGTVSQYDIGTGGTLTPKSPATVSAGSSPVAVALSPPLPQCSDGIDNDGDGKIDFGTGASNDPGCLSPTDNTESTDANPQCSDELDNDGDGKIDFGTGASNDPGCSSPTDNTENTDANPECSDEVDDDADGKIDFGSGTSNDPGCISDGDDTEETDSNPECSDELDDDGDTKIDFGTGAFNDPGCESPTDDSESPDPSVIQTASFPAQADARVEEEGSSSNFGSSTILRVDNDDEVWSYLRFNPTGISGSILSAKLKVFATEGTSNGPAAYKTNWTGSESSLTWNNKTSATSGATDDKGSIPSGTFVEYNVTPLVTGNGLHSFILRTTSSDGVDFASKETSIAARRPELIVTYGTDTQDPDPPTLTAQAASSTQVNLSWSGATDNFGVTGYNVYRDNVLRAPLGNQTSYTDSASPGQTYVYEVTALDAAGNESARSNAVTVKTPFTFTAVADARVEQANSSTNFGTSTLLRVDAGSDPDVETFLRFQLSGVSTISNAKLRLWVTNGTTNGPAAFKTNWTTSETFLRWSNKPGPTSGATDDKGSISSNSFVDFNVTSLVVPNVANSFRLAGTSTDAVDFSSRETSTSSRRPQLLVTP